MSRLLIRSTSAFALMGLCCVAIWPSAAKAEPDPCAEALRILHSTASELASGHQVYRQAPTLLPGRNKTLAVDLLIKRANVFIGPYRVEGVPVIAVTPRPGEGTEAYIRDVAGGRNVRIPGECLSRPELIYGGTRWKMEHGDRIDAYYRSALDFNKNTLSPPNTGGAPCNASNLHGHGLLVPPRQGNADTGESYGDYVYDVTLPQSAHSSPVDTCDPPSGAASAPAAVPSRAPSNGPSERFHLGRELQREMPDLQRGRPVNPAAAEHKGHLTTSNPIHYEIDIPRGRVRQGDPIHDPLSTGYHPSGLMWYHTHPHGYSRAQLNGGTSGFISVGGVCDNLVRDDGSCREDSWNLHYIGLKDVQLDNKGTVDAQGRSAFAFGKGYDFALCANDMARAKTANRTFKGECNGPGPKPGKWLFTLNGMLYPTIKTIPGKTDVWLMANMSPNVSFNLQVVRVSDGALQQVKVLAVDGVSADQYTTDSVFMMPGSRAEIMLNLDHGEYIFRQAGFHTGLDDLPAIDLARIIIDEPAPLRRRFVHPYQQSFNRVRSLFPSFEPEPLPPVYAPAGAKEACAKEGVRHVHFIWQKKDPKNSNSKEIFGLFAGIQGPRDPAPVYFDGDGRPTRKSARALYQELDRKDASGKLIHPNGVAFSSQQYGAICTMKGREETWVVYNWTPEIHNLHLHQARFRLDKNNLQSSLPRYDTAQMQKRGVTSDVLERAHGANRSLEFMERLLKPSRQSHGFAEAYHDSIPIMMGTPRPGGECDGSPDNPGCSPSSITIKVRLDRDETVGAMVYHCHILEHEDNGMMGMFRVCDPSKSRNDRDADPECFSN
jgi:FtsP/CotA-like multicopper oxidase with cupredoxin domain